VKRQGRVWAADSGTLLEPGDLVRFTYSSEHACYLALFGQDARATQVYFPNGARAAFVRGGAAVPLDFSVELDTTPGEEHVHALFCDSSIELAPLRAALAETGRLAAPEGCKVQTLSLRKAGPR
jgi:hypothetical protein